MCFYFLYLWYRKYYYSPYQSNHSRKLTCSSFTITLHELTDIAFNQPRIYTIEDINGHDTILGLLKQMGKNDQIDKILQDKMNGFALTPSQLQMAQAFQELAMEPIRRFFMNVIFTICVIFLVYVIITITWAFRYTIGRIIPSLARIRLTKAIFFETEHSYISSHPTSEDLTFSLPPTPLNNKDTEELIPVNAVSAHHLMEALSTLRRIN